MAELYNLVSELEDDTVVDLNDYEEIKKIVCVRYVSASMMHVEQLKQEDGSIVFNLIFYDLEEEEVGGAEVTKETIYWDDNE
jgi:hypothetical protein